MENKMFQQLELSKVHEISYPNWELCGMVFFDLQECKNYNIYRAPWILGDTSRTAQNLRPAQIADPQNQD